MQSARDSVVVNSLVCFVKSVYLNRGEMYVLNFIADGNLFRPIISALSHSFSVTLTSLHRVYVQTHH